MKSAKKNKPIGCRKFDFRFLLVFAAIFAATTAFAGRAYLKVVGVPDLRFQIVTTNNFVFNPAQENVQSAVKPAEMATNSSTTTNKMNNLVAANSVNPTNLTTASLPNSITAPNPVQNPTISQPQMDVSDKKNPTQPFNVGISAPTASDLLTVTPQMIADYLKPNSGGANSLDQHGVVVFVPADLQFTPPTPDNPGESRATYHSQ